MQAVGGFCSACAYLLLYAQARGFSAKRQQQNSSIGQTSCEHKQIAEAQSAEDSKAQHDYDTDQSRLKEALILLPFGKNPLSRCKESAANL